MKLMKKMIEDHKNQYEKEKYEEIRSGDDSQGNEVSEESDPCPA